MTAHIRHAVKIAASQATSDGAGVRLRRSLGTANLPMVDPFLMLDEFRSDRPGDYIAGFPAHPHRGFETVTIMLAGAMEHKDSQGNTGHLGPGSVQWMTAGRGIIHSEMPQQQDGLMWGFQLWVNLPARDKMTAPRYQDIPADAIPQVAIAEGGSVRVIAGTYASVQGPIVGVATEPVLFDVRLPQGSTFTAAVPPSHSAFVYPFEGSITVPGHPNAIPRSHAVVLGAGNTVTVSATPAEAARVLLVAGRPIDEPVARHGPFVMNTRTELEQAFRDYQSGALGR